MPAPLSPPSVRRREGSGKPGAAAEAGKPARGAGNRRGERETGAGSGDPAARTRELGLAGVPDGDLGGVRGPRSPAAQSCDFVLGVERKVVDPGNVASTCVDTGDARTCGAAARDRQGG